MRYIIGIDEVGRGSLAGPVVVAAVAMPISYHINNRQLGRLKDSKKLSSEKREAWFKYFKSNSHIRYSTARLYSSKIDALNISLAANLAAGRAYQKLIKKARLEKCNCRIVIDGGLFLFNKDDSAGFYGAETIIKGDEKFSSVMVASIIAKVIRDKYMILLEKKYPRYGFLINKGYGTKSHLQAISRFGSSPAHRLTFIKKYSNIKKIINK